jgi:GTPase SAR1 family protein
MLPFFSECKAQAPCKVLFIGPAGAGKSTIINVLFNNQVNADAMSRPAGTGDTTSGQTGFFTTYYDLPDYAYTDSIGLGDPRFQPEDVMDSLKSVLEMASVGYNKIYICLQYGRIPTDTRKYIELITTVFGKRVLKWSSLIFTRCNDQTMTKEKFLMKNSGDADIVEIVNRVNTVIFGDNMADTDPELEKVLCQRRKDFLDRIKRDLDETASAELFRLKKQSLIARARKVMKIYFGSHAKVNSILSDVRSFALAVAAAMQSSKYRYYFGECTICLDGVTDENQPIITQCSHVYHKACLKKWVRRNPDNSCPVCRTRFDNPEKFYENLVGKI